MYNLDEIDIDTLESMTIYLADESRDDKEEWTTFGNPFGWIRIPFTIRGVRSQVNDLKKKIKDEATLRQHLRNLLSRNCQWKNGKSQDKRIKETLEIFNYLSIEEEFEADLK